MPFSIRTTEKFETALFIHLFILLFIYLFIYLFVCLLTNHIIKLQSSNTAFRPVGIFASQCFNIRRQHYQLLFCFQNVQLSKCIKDEFEAVKMHFIVRCQNNWHSYRHWFVGGMINGGVQPQLRVLCRPISGGVHGHQIIWAVYEADDRIHSITKACRPPF